MPDELTAAREALADYDIPRCETTWTHPSGTVYRCCWPAGHPSDIPQRAHDFGPRSTAVSVEHLRAALAEVDRLTGEIAWQEERHGTRAEQEADEADMAAELDTINAMSDDEVNASLDAAGVDRELARRKLDALVRVCTERLTLTMKLEKAETERDALRTQIAEMEVARSSYDHLSDAMQRLAAEGNGMVALTSKDGAWFGLVTQAHGPVDRLLLGALDEVRDVFNGMEDVFADGDRVDEDALASAINNECFTLTERICRRQAPEPEDAIASGAHREKA